MANTLHTLIKEQRLRHECMKQISVIPLENTPLHRSLDQKRLGRVDKLPPVSCFALHVDPISVSLPHSFVNVVKTAATVFTVSSLQQHSAMPFYSF